MKVEKVMIDGNEAAAHVAYQVNDVIAIYPITPSSTMGELCDQWASEGKKNIWGVVPDVVEMQSEAGAVGAVHGSLQTGSLTCTFTASQGLLLMIPNMLKIAGELTPTVFHVAARSLATHALSIFGDHSDVMATRSTGWAMLASAGVQEAMDFALIAQMATLEARVPFLHFFDGFRTSHEVNKAELLDGQLIKELISVDLVQAHRNRGLSPEHPVIRGTAQNPDVFFQAREAANPYYLACPLIVQEAMNKFAKLSGRQYHLFEYVGHPEATDVVILMGSGCDAAHETVDYLLAKGEKIGLLKVRLFRPFSIDHFISALPKTVKSIAVLDRTKESGATGEPLYLDVITALHEAQLAAGTRIIGGRYGLSSKEFTPGMIKSVFDNLKSPNPKNHFTVGIVDDVTHTSLEWDHDFCTEDPQSVRAIFWGLGSDGTVSANKNSIKIIGDVTDLNAQGYFVYDSKKAGSVTVSHLRFGSRPIRATYLIERANFIAVHQFAFLEKLEVLTNAENNATVLLNSPFGPDEVWDNLPISFQKEVIAKSLKLYVVDADSIARESGLGRRINTVLQVAFFAITNVIPLEEAIADIKHKIELTYGKRGEQIVKRNWDAVDATIARVHQVNISGKVTAKRDLLPVVSNNAPEFVKNLTAEIMARRGDLLPVSAFPPDGTFPTATAKWEKRSIAQDVPVWDQDVCIQCGKCILICPHAVIRSKVYDASNLEGAPAHFRSSKAKWREFKDQLYTLQVSPDDCTGCALCVEVCPAKNKSNASLRAINMTPLAQVRDVENENWDFFENMLPYKSAAGLNTNAVKDLQLIEPLFEFSGACAGCGETPYIKLMSQLYGDRAIIANATGCSSIYGGNLPTTPWTVNKDGRGPAWANSLFEDNAEFGLGMRISLDAQINYAITLLKSLSSELGDGLVNAILGCKQIDDSEIQEQRQRVAELNKLLKNINRPEARELANMSEVLVKRSVWIIGGDGWAYDIGYGGLDHVFASGRNVTILVLDTEVYSNTGGQNSKSTPRGAVAKFAMAGKQLAKKDLALLAMTYRDVYVARVAIGANEQQTIKAFKEAESFNGPALILAYSHCVAHGYDLIHGLSQQKLAVDSGYWPLIRYNPSLAGTSAPVFSLDSKPPAIPLKQYAYNETRYSVLLHSRPDDAERLMVAAQEDVMVRWRIYSQLAESQTRSQEKAAENTSAPDTAN